MRLIRRVANRAKDYLLFNASLESYWIDRGRGSITALLYHQVASSEDGGFLTRGGSPVITPDAFRRELSFLIARRVRFFTFGQILAGEFPDSSEFGVAICFDDCFRNNYTTGLTILQELGVPATFFQSTAMVDASELIWEHRLYWHARNPASAQALAKLAAEIVPIDARGGPDARKQTIVEWLRESLPMDDCAEVLDAADKQFGGFAEMRQIPRSLYPNSEHLRRARSFGHDIGSHGHHHYKRSNISEALFEQELMQSSTLIESIIRERPTCFSYPFDSHFASDAEICRRHYSGAATVAKRRIDDKHDAMWLPRFTWPGPARNGLRMRRWLLTGQI